MAFWPAINELSYPKALFGTRSSARDLVRPRFGSRSSVFRSALFVLGSARLGDGSRLIQLGARLGTRLGLAPGLAQAEDRSALFEARLGSKRGQGRGNYFEGGGGGQTSPGVQGTPTKN